MALSSQPADLRWDVPTAEALRRLAADPLPLGLRAGETARSYHRDLYLDTPDGALRLRGATCRFRLRFDDRRELLLSHVTEVRGRTELHHLIASVSETEPLQALQGASEPARVLRAMVSPSALRVELELETERYTRVATAGLLGRPLYELRYDVVTVRAAGLVRSFQELGLLRLRSGKPQMEEVAGAFSEAYGLRAVSADRRARGTLMRAALESEALARAVEPGRWVVVMAMDGSRVACLVEGETVRLPVAEGSGEEACRHVLRSVLGSAVGDLHLLDTVKGDGHVRSLQIWVVTRVNRSARPPSGLELDWVSIDKLRERASAGEIVDPSSLAAIATLTNVEVVPGVPASGDADAIEVTGPSGPHRRITGEEPVITETDARLGPMLDAELSLLEFNARVLALAEDPSVPLLERVRYLSIVSTNLDEFFMVRVGGIKYESLEVAAESSRGAADSRRLAKIGRRARALIARQYRCFESCRAELASRGIRLRSLFELDEAERERLREYFRSVIFPYLTPRAITSTPGHSLPVIPDQTLLIGVLLRDTRGGVTGPLHLAELTIPQALPRFIKLSEPNQLVAIEDVILPELHLVYPGRTVEHAYLFRLTRDSDLDVDEGLTGNLVQAIEERARRRRYRPVVRIEVERMMPATLRELLLRELKLEPDARASALDKEDIYEIDGLMDLGALRELAALPVEGLHFPRFQPNAPLDPKRSLWEHLRERDVLVHHPYDDFDSTVQRFFDEAADDPDVVAMKLALYRAGERSPIVDALLRAAGAGKDVSVFVELKARFDEYRNVRWARQLEAAGVHVVHGVAGAKNHAKVALVIRREHDVPRRYVHIGTGNYNAGTARAYTDLGLLTAREEICADIHDLFNALTGSSAPAAHAFRSCLIAPHGLLPGLLERIHREAEHARAGRGGRIRMKVNGLSDREVISAMYEASQAGVEIDLVVRGICTLAPGVEGTSDHIRVMSVLGRFLEHARVYYFANGGEPEYFIGSADLRPRNLRRRVEVLAPVLDPELRARLDTILALELDDPHAWELAADGSYARRSNGDRAPARDSTQNTLIALATDARMAHLS